MYVAFTYVKDLPHKGKTVRVQPRRRQADDGIARLYKRRVQELRPVSHTHAETGEVIFVGRIKPWHLCRFAAYEGASRLHAAVRNAGHYLLHLLGVVFPNRKVIQKEKRLCPAAYYVVNAHGDAVYAYGVVLVHKESYLKLCAHAVGSAYEYRLLHAGYVRLKKPAEAAQPRNHAGNHCFFDVAFHKLHRLVTGGNVNACRFVALAVTCHLYALQHFKASAI